MNGRKLIGIREKVKKELEHIPKGDVYQNWIRQLYFNLRMSSLGKKSKYHDDKNEILKIAIKDALKFAKENKGYFIPKYDKNFFKI